MGLRQRWNALRNRPRREKEVEAVVPDKTDLREFVYLDEVSLRSLLSSLEGDLRDGASAQASDNLQAEISGALKAGHSLAGAEANLSSRFQTTTGSMIQTTTKATVQSWFKDFRTIDGIRLIELAKPKEPAVDEGALLSTTDTSLLVGAEDLMRGELVEFRVRLSADPVYRLGTIVSELSGMASDYPEMFEAGGSLASLRDAQPLGKVLDRLLVGLIPIRAHAVDYSIVTIRGIKYVAHNTLLRGLGLPSEPLQIVGITEQVGYWKDLRRVLFSEAEVTLLGRIARTGLHASWTPVKLADLFSDFAPNLVSQINAAGQISFDVPQAPTQNANEIKLANALRLYADSILEANGSVPSSTEQNLLLQEISSLSGRCGSVSEQRSAFAIMRNRVADLTGATVGARRELKLREQARMAAGLPLFPALAASVVSNATTSTNSPVEVENILDAEIVAIYW